MLPFWHNPLKNFFFLLSFTLFSIISTSVSFAATSTLTFNDLSSPDRNLSGQYPTGVVDWGTNKWWLSSPWGGFTTNSISYLNESTKSQTFSFLTPRRLVSVDVYNGGTASTTVTLACTGNTTRSQVVNSQQTLTISTNWTTTCTTITLGNTNGWWTNFDNFVIAN